MIIIYYPLYKSSKTKIFKATSKQSILRIREKLSSPQLAYIFIFFKEEIFVTRALWLYDLLLALSKIDHNIPSLTSLKAISELSDPSKTWLNKPGLVGYERSLIIKEVNGVKKVFIKPVYLTAKLV